jgi:MipA family protein
MPHMSPRIKPLLIVSLLVAFTAFSDLARAQAEPNVETPNRPLWEAGVAGIGLTSPAYPGADERVSRAIALPWFIYRGPVFRADGDTVGARVLKTKTVEFDIGFAAALGASSNDVEVREGMPDLGFQFEFGPRVRVNLARPTPSSIIRLDIPLRGVFELDSGIKHRGFAFEPRLSYDNRDIGGGWGLSSSASVVVGDSKYNEFLYGVPTLFANRTRPAYEAKSGIITPRVLLALSRAVTKDLRIFAFTRYDFANAGANRSSPLHVSDGGASFGIGATWTLGRSSRMAPD